MLEKFRSTDKLPFNTWEYLLEALSIALLGGFLMGMVLMYPELPERIPRHFNLAGEADSWGDKSILWVFFALALLCYAGLSILAKYPNKYNYPVPIHEHNIAAQYRLARQLITSIKMMSIALFTGMGTILIWSSIMGESAYGGSTWWLLLMLLLIFAQLVFYIRRARKLL